MGVARSGYLRGALILLAILSVVSAAASAAGKGAASDPLAGYAWVYLRGGQLLQAGETLLELAAAGDTSLARGMDPQSAFSRAGSWLRAADFALINLECALSDRPALPAAAGSPNEPYRLVAPPGAVDSLRQAGIDIAGLANNHTLDAGPAGLEDTANALESSGIAALGAGVDAASAAEPRILSAAGVKVAFLAFNAVPSPDQAQDGWTIAQWEREPALAAVRRAAILADAVVVSLHWGYEYEQHASDSQVELAQALIAAGADLVIGHHPHAAQELLLQRRADGSSGLAALSLGNFAFDQARAETRSGLALRAFFDRGGLRSVQALPVLAGLRPALAAAGTPLPQIVASTPRWEEISFTCSGETCTENNTPGSSAPSGSSAGIFRSGRSELTGDQQLEDIRLEDHRLTIRSAGMPDWQSPLEWHILDLALGDPDSDGRGDLVLAMEKADNQGQVQSHPFVIGYRGGVYRTVWGGSAVRDPLKEVELGDLDSDGQVELVVLEQERGGKGRAVTVWRWHGWGFSLDWRSAYAEYEDLRLSGREIRVKRLKD